MPRASMNRSRKRDDGYLQDLSNGNRHQNRECDFGAHGCASGAYGRGVDLGRGRTRADGMRGGLVALLAKQKPRTANRSQPCSDNDAGCVRVTAPPQDGFRSAKARSADRSRTLAWRAAFRKKHGCVSLRARPSCRSACVSGLSVAKDAPRHRLAGRWGARSDARDPARALGERRRYRVCAWRRGRAALAALDIGRTGPTLELKRRD